MAEIGTPGLLASFSGIMISALSAEGILFAESLGKEKLQESPGLSNRIKASDRRCGKRPRLCLCFAAGGPCAVKP
jgi:hypothetical protein